MLEDDVQAVEAAQARRDRLTVQIAAVLPDWTLAPIVAALQTMRGMALVNAVTLIAELGDLSRFANPRQRMAYLGLVPSEYSSGASVKRGGLTKAGNSAAQRLLVEAARVTAFPPGSAASGCAPGGATQADPRDRLEGAAPGLRPLSPTRPRRQPANVVTAAIARELAGFVRAIARQVPVTVG